MCIEPFLSSRALTLKAPARKLMAPDHEFFNGIIDICTMSQTPFESVLRAIFPSARHRGRLAKRRVGENMKPTSRPDGEVASANITKRIEELGDWRGETLARIRQLIHDADPDIQEEWKWMGTPTWSHDGGVCTGESYKQVVKLTFFRGASIKDPKKLFNSSLEGNTRRAIDFREGEKINEAAFKQLVRAAVKANSSVRTQQAAKKR